MVLHGQPTSSLGSRKQLIDVGFYKSDSQSRTIRLCDFLHFAQHWCSHMNCSHVC